MRTHPRMYVALARLVAKGMFRRERKALAGNLRPRSTSPSILHFCYNRCGSRYVSSLIQRLVEPRGYEFIDYERYHTHCDRPGLARLDDPEFLNPRLHRRGVHYGPFYRLHAGFTDLDEFKIVLTLRDPRDVLTSRFYSQAYAHTLFEQANIERREQVRKMGVDAFVLEQADEIIRRYERYHSILDRENVLFLPYEQMVGEFDEWLARLADFIGAGEEATALEAIRTEADFSVRKEDKFSHRRSVKPGNHREKLKAETVEILNTRLANLLEQFGYSECDPAPVHKERKHG